MAEHTTAIGPLGPLINVGIAVGIPYAMLGLGGPPGSYTALVDTGASLTAISPSVQRVLQAQAQAIGRRAVERPGAGAIFRPVLDLRLKFEGHLSGHRWFDLPAIEAKPATPGVDVLIGRDVLAQIVFTWDGPKGRFVLSY